MYVAIVKFQKLSSSFSIANLFTTRRTVPEFRSGRNCDFVKDPVSGVGGWME